MSVQQLEALMDYLEGQQELALGRCIRSKEGRSLAKRLWQECATILNNVSVDCAQKTGEQWRMFYNDYKHRLLKKIKKEKIERSATGGGIAEISGLSPIQERLYTILGRDVGEPIPGVRHNPFIPIENAGGSGSASYHDGINVVTDEVPVLNLGFIEMEVERLNLGASYNTIDIFDEYEVPVETETASSMPLPIEPASSMLVPPEPASSVPVPIEPASSQATQQPEQAAPRRRRRRRRQEMDAEPEDQSTLRTATDMLQNIEVASANATNRLAAAIETLAARLSEPIRIVLEQPASTPRRRPQRVHRRNRIIIDSDSD